jgi:hypothetical protein
MYMLAGWGFSAGVAQQNLSGSNIGEDASNVRQNLRALAATELPTAAREAGRMEVLPVQWRKHLRLDVRPHPTAVTSALATPQEVSRSSACVGQPSQLDSLVRMGIFE